MLHVPESTHLSLLRETAHDYLALGWSIIPLVGKLPALRSWKEFQARLPIACEVANWFNSKQPPTGLAIVTGRLSGLVVVDCDTVEDADYWKVSFPNTPLVVETGGGGFHFYYRMPAAAEVRNRSGVFHRRIDIRGEGGYIVAPPSLHPNGRRYKWSSSHHADELPVFERNWIEVIEPNASTARLPVFPKIHSAVAYIHRIHAIAGEGGHNATYRAVCKLRDAGLSVEEALAVLTNWNESNASPPWSPDELTHKVASAYTSPRSH